MVFVAHAHLERIVLEAFIAGIEACSDPDANDAAGALCSLYALTSLEADPGWFL